MFSTWLRCKRRSRIAVASTSSPASTSGQSAMPLFVGIRIEPRTRGWRPLSSRGRPPACGAARARRAPRCQHARRRRAVARAPACSRGSSRALRCSVQLRDVGVRGSVGEGAAVLKQPLTRAGARTSRSAEFVFARQVGFAVAATSSTLRHHRCKISPSRSPVPASTRRMTRQGRSSAAVSRTRCASSAMRALSSSLGPAGAVGGAARAGGPPHSAAPTAGTP
jgi:hypothetical protein